MFFSGCRQADIGFLLDSSSSVGSRNFQKEKHFVETFANNFHISPHRIQIAVATYSSRVHDQFHFNTHANQQSTLQGIAAIPYTAGNTHTDVALEFASHTLFRIQNGDRPTAPNFLIVITDGRSISSSLTYAAANILHKEHIKTFAIGVGARIHQNELNHIASDPQHVFTVDTFDALHTLQNELHNKVTCNNG